MERIQLRRDISTKWTEINPILMEGEVGFEIDTKLRKIGDGVTAWNNLDYLAAENVVQELGTSDTGVISQNVVTKNFTKTNDTINSLLGTSDYIIPSYTTISGYSINPNTGEPDSNVNYTYTSFINLSKGDAILVRADGVDTELAGIYTAVISVYDTYGTYTHNYLIGGVNVRHYIAIQDCKVRVCAYGARFSFNNLIQIIHSNVIADVTYINTDIVLNKQATIIDQENLSKDLSDISSKTIESPCVNTGLVDIDLHNLSLTSPDIVQVSDPEYTITQQFSKITTITSATGSFVGFPTSIVFNNKLYCFYYKSTSHTSTPGKHDNIFYKSSSDGGITWSAEKEWILPESDTVGLVRSYRAAYVTRYGNHILCGLFVTTLTQIEQAGSFTMLVELDIDDYDNIDILNNIRVPLVINDNVVYNYTDGDITNSMIIGGGLIQVDTNYFIGAYDSYRNFYVFNFNGDFSTNSNITILDKISHTTRYNFSEHTFIKFDNNTIYMLLREDSRIGNFYYKYNTSTNKFDFIDTLQRDNYEGMDSIKLNKDICAVFGRNITSLENPSRFSMLNKSGRFFMEGAVFYLSNVSKDAAYSTLQVIDNRLINIFYIKTSETEYNYSIVTNSIEIDTLTNLIYY